MMRSLPASLWTVSRNQVLRTFPAASPWYARCPASLRLRSITLVSRVDAQKKHRIASAKALYACLRRSATAFRTGAAHDEAAWIRDAKRLLARRPQRAARRMGCDVAPACDGVLRGTALRDEVIHAELHYARPVR